MAGGESESTCAEAVDKCLTAVRATSISLPLWYIAVVTGDTTLTIGPSERLNIQHTDYHLHDFVYVEDENANNLLNRHGGGWAGRMSAHRAMRRSVRRGGRACKNAWTLVAGRGQGAIDVCGWLKARAPILNEPEGAVASRNEPW